MRRMTETDLFEALRRGDYAFLDAGSGDGDSTSRCEQRFRLGQGLGIERNPERVETAVATGRAAMCRDALAIALPAKCVSFVAMCDFLEHLPDERFVRRALQTYGEAARDFLFIQHPTFENADYLANLEMKVAWTDWTDHPTMMTIADYRRMFASLGWHDVTIHPIGPIHDSFHHAILPLSAKSDAPEFDPERHDPKPLIVFERPLYARYDIFVRLNPKLDEEEWRRITAPVDTVLQEGGDTVAAFRRDTAQWHVRSSVLDDAGQSVFRFGPPGTPLTPLFGDWDGDGVASPGFYDPACGAFHLSNDRLGGSVTIRFEFGPIGGLPVIGDWDGDGADGVGVYDPGQGQFWLRNRLDYGVADHAFGFGPPGSSLVPVAGDWDGDGVDTVGLYCADTTDFFLAGAHAAGDAERILRFGPAGAVPVVGDWDGDGRDGIGVYVQRGARWRLRCEPAEGLDDVRFRFGPEKAVPLRVRAPRNPK